MGRTKAGRPATIHCEGEKNQRPRTIICRHWLCDSTHIHKITWIGTSNQKEHDSILQNEISLSAMVTTSCCRFSDNLAVDGGSFARPIGQCSEEFEKFSYDFACVYKFSWNFTWRVHFKIVTSRFAQTTRRVGNSFPPSSSQQRFGGETTGEELR